MGVMGWTPQAVIYQSNISDLAIAFEGYRLFNSTDEKGDKILPSKDFMSEMIKKFPDIKE